MSKAATQSSDRWNDLLEPVGQLEDSAHQTLEAVFAEDQALEAVLGEYCRFVMYGKGPSSAEPAAPSSYSLRWRSLPRLAASLRIAIENSVEPFEMLDEDRLARELFDGWLAVAGKLPGEVILEACKRHGQLYGEAAESLWTGFADASRPAIAVELALASEVAVLQAFFVTLPRPPANYLLRLARTGWLLLWPRGRKLLFLESIGATARPPWGRMPKVEEFHQLCAEHAQEWREVSVEMQASFDDGQSRSSESLERLRRLAERSKEEISLPQMDELELWRESMEAELKGLERERLKLKIELDQGSLDPSEERSHTDDEEYNP